MSSARGSSRGGGGGGRGEYYRNKYGGRGRNSGRNTGGGGGRGGRGRGSSPNNQNNNSQQGGSFQSLANILSSIDGKQYPAYHSIESPTIGWSYQTPNTNMAFTLYIHKTQSDPYASPTQCRILIPNTSAKFPPAAFSRKIRAIATADFVHRLMFQNCHTMGASTQNADGGRGGWKGPKGGTIDIAPPTQHVFEQSAATMNSKGDITVQFTLPLPARGRTVMGYEANQLLTKTLPTILQKSVFYSSAIQNNPQLQTKFRHHVDNIEDQEYLRKQLESKNCIGFVRNGAILPRSSGAHDTPMSNAKQEVCPFQSPSSMNVSIELPNLKQTITGMGIPKGITLIVGGGFHGKSTLLEALQNGVYNKIPGDGREFVVMEPSCMKIRAEDGRRVEQVNISPFIQNLPRKKDTTCFSSLDASGSTSQASNIMEAIEVGVKTLLVDEDTCATNFMIRDDKMMQLVAKEKEPITPFVQKIRPLYQQHSISCILVIGGSGDYFSVADKVIMMDNYECLDVTERAHSISPPISSSSHNNFGTITPRYPMGSSMDIQNIRVKVRTKNVVEFGEVGELDISGLEQVVNIGQTNGIVAALKQLPMILDKMQTGSSSKSDLSLHDVMVYLNKMMDEKGLNGVLAPGQIHGNLSRPRIFEIAGALNRLRMDGSIVQLK